MSKYRITVCPCCNSSTRGRKTTLVSAMDTGRLVALKPFEGQTVCWNCCYPSSKSIKPSPGDLLGSGGNVPWRDNTAEARKAPKEESGWLL